MRIFEFDINRGRVIVYEEEKEKYIRNFLFGVDCDKITFNEVLGDIGIYMSGTKRVYGYGVNTSNVNFDWIDEIRIKGGCL